MAFAIGYGVQGTSPTTLGETDYLQFCSGTFDGPITVAAYQDSTHVRSSGGVDVSAANTPNNVKYIASGTADWGDGTEACANMLTTEATLKVTVSYDSNITVSGISFYAYDGTTTTNAPVGMTVQAFEYGDSAWTNAEGSGSALSLGDSSTPATDHHFYIAVSVSPESIGVKSANKVRFACTYQ